MTSARDHLTEMMSSVKFHTRCILLGDRVRDGQVWECLKDGSLYTVRKVDDWGHLWFRKTPSSQSWDFTTDCHPTDIMNGNKLIASPHIRDAIALKVSGNWKSEVWNEES